MEKIGKYFYLFSIVLLLFFLNPYVFKERARGETHFIESLALVRFDEKVKAQNFTILLR